MKKINNIDYNNKTITIDSLDGFIYKIPNNNSYVRNLLYKGINENKELNKDIKYYDKCADICIYPIWLAFALLVYGYATKFIMFDLVLIGCGLITGTSLIGSTLFKQVSKKLQKQANNNENFIKLYEYAKNGGKINENKKKFQNTKVKENNKTNTQYQTGKKIENNKPTRVSSEFHLNKNQIIQDEPNHQRKR